MGSLDSELFLACFLGDVERVKFYLDRGANMNVICSTGRTPFGTAAQQGNVEILQVFLDHCKRGDKSKVKYSSELKSNLESNSVNKKSKSNSECFVSCNNVQSALSSTGAHSDLNLNNDVIQNKFSELLDKDLAQLRLIDDTEVLLSRVDKTSYDLATFNDSFVRRDPRFKSKNWINEIDLSCEDEDLTPDGMDKLEWDTEVDEHKEISTEPEEEDPGCALTILYQGMRRSQDYWGLQTSGDYWGLQTSGDFLELQTSGDFLGLEAYGDFLGFQTNEEDLELPASALLDEKPPPNDIDREDRFGCRALHYAAVEGHIDAVRLLINAGCRVNVGDSDNLTPLHLAASKDIPEVVELLIEAGANVNDKTTDRISPLHVSTSRGLLNNVKLLVNAGAHIDTLDSSDRSPLFMAVSRSHDKVVAYLLERGAKVNLEEIHGYTSLYEAVWQKNTKIVKMLLNAGAKITHSHHLLHYAVLCNLEEIVKLLLQAGTFINLRDEYGDTPLLVTTKTGQADMARLLLSRGASINSRNNVSGNTPLHEIVYHMGNSKREFDEMFSVLQKFRVDLEAECYTGYTALCIAINRGHDEAAATLIRHGADVNHNKIHEMDLFTQILRRGNRFLSELFIYAGYRFLKIQLRKEASTPLERWVSRLEVNPMRLSDLCRLKVRRQFKSRVYEKVSALVLPSAIKTFLKLEDITNENNCS